MSIYRSTATLKCSGKWLHCVGKESKGKVRVGRLASYYYWSVFLSARSKHRQPTIYWLLQSGGSQPALATMLMMMTTMMMMMMMMMMVMMMHAHLRITSRSSQPVDYKNIVIVLAPAVGVVRRHLNRGPSCLWLQRTVVSDRLDCTRKHGAAAHRRTQAQNCASEHVAAATAPPYHAGA